MSQNNPIECPKCSSPNVAGEMGAFWVGLDSERHPQGQWNDYEGSTDLTGKLLCSDCEHEWSEGEGGSS